MPRKKKEKDKPEFLVEFTKDTKDELEIKFTMNLYKKIKAENTKILNNDMWIETEKSLFEKSIASRELAEVLKNELNNRGVDAYAYEAHPLVPGYFLHVSGNNPKKSTKTALNNVRNDWNSLKEAIEKELR